MNIRKGQSEEYNIFEYESADPPTKISIRTDNTRSKERFLHLGEDLRE